MEFDLKNYLKKFEAFLPHETKVRNSVIIAIKEVLGIEVDRKKIKVQGNRVMIQGSSSLKSELVMKQVKLLERVQKENPTITTIN